VNGTDKENCISEMYFYSADGNRTAKIRVHHNQTKGLRGVVQLEEGEEILGIYGSN